MSLPDEAFVRVRELRAEGCTHRCIAELIHQEFAGGWEPAWDSFTGSILCAEAGIDSEAEFSDYIAWQESGGIYGNRKE